MKQIKIVLLMVILTGLCSCRKNLLTIQPSNLLTNAQVLTNDASVTAYMASLYRDLPMEDFSFCEGSFWRFPDAGQQYTADLSDEAQYQWNNPTLINSNVYDILYKAIRNVNTFISLMTATTNFPAAQQAAYIAEAKFIRAYYYFGLVKYYGGVPLVLTIPTTPVPLPRNKETDIYDQIKKDCDDAAAGLPGVADGIKAGFLNSATVINGITYGYGRANKYVALALEARAMLHGGSIGLFAANDPNYASAIGTYNGIIGVDAAHAQVYMQSAFDASDAIIKSGVFSLYTKYNPADPVKNFQYLFYDTKQGDSNTEAIFNRGYDYATSNNYTHSQDLETFPHYWSVQMSAQGYGNALQPSLDLMEKYENTDGSPQTVGSGTPNAQYHFPAMTTPFVNKDPRYHGTIISNGTQFRGATITGQKGVILNGALYSSNDYVQFFDTNPASSTYKQFNINVAKFNGGAATTYVTGSGNSSNGDQSAWLKKWGDPITDISLLHDYSSRTSWMDMRLGEVLLDHAEASFELGHATSESLGDINQLRARATLQPLSTISRALIRHERLVETAFENKNWWDYVRWRSLNTDFNNRQEYNLQCYYDIDTQDYVYIKVTDGGLRTVNYKLYYADIPAADVSTNPLLKPSHNPGY